LTISNGNSITSLVSLHPMWRAKSNLAVDTDTKRQGPRGAVGNRAPRGPLPLGAGHLYVIRHDRPRHASIP
jgi:hypothetical protein